MLSILKHPVPRTPDTAGPFTPLRCIRPSLLDLRFTGDPWAVGHKDGRAWVQLDKYRLARIPINSYCSCVNGKFVVAITISFAPKVEAGATATLLFRVSRNTVRRLPCVPP